MESEKVKEIKVKEALEILCYKHKDVGSWEITKLQLMDILTLINELESENERLLEQRNKTYNIWAKDTEKLKDRIAELEEYIKDNQSNAKAFVENRHSDLKKELTSFAEKLRGKAIRRQEFIGELAIDAVEYVNVKDIDKTLKEFLGK